MSDFGVLSGAFVAGMVLGTLFFAGLWWTVSHGLPATHPAMWFGFSALLRMAITVWGLYYVARLGWPALTASLCGLLAARATVTHFTRRPVD